MVFLPAICVGMGECASVAGMVVLGHVWWPLLAARATTAMRQYLNQIDVI